MLPDLLQGHLRLPVLGAPMFIVSGPELVIAAPDRLPVTWQRDPDVSNWAVVAGNVCVRIVTASADRATVEIVVHRS